MGGAAFWLALFSLLGFFAQMAMNAVLILREMQDRKRETALEQREAELEARETKLEKRVAKRVTNHVRAEIKAGRPAR
jgi:membrane protein implicated in regulation of membrane protease activity